MRTNKSWPKGLPIKAYKLECYTGTLTKKLKYDFMLDYKLEHALEFYKWKLSRRVIKTIWKLTR